MEKKNKLNHPAFKISAIIIFTGLCALVTAVVVIPIPKTSGYINLVDALVYFTGFLFGPFTGFLSGGLGPAFADIGLGYTVWAPWSVLAHGLQGLVAGLLSYVLRRKETIPLPAYIITGVIGTIVMVGTYFIGGTVIEGAAASAAQIPFNIIQSVIGIIIALPLVKAVQAAYPPVKDYLF